MPDTLTTIALPAGFLTAARDLLGPSGWSDDAERMAPKLADWRGRFHGETPFLALPASTEEVAALVALCAEHRVPVTPQGGNTGLVDGGLPHGEILVSLSRMDRIREVDGFNNSMVAEAGTILSNVHDAAGNADRFFPLSLGSQGQATIGGLVSTNAGGVAVLRYGMMRDLILGLEVVTADGRIWNGLTGLRKNNTGYDLKHLFAGAEGTLGIITAANLKLFPQTKQVTAWAVLDTPQQAVELLASLRSAAGDTVTSFEIIPANAVQMVVEDEATISDPLPSDAPWRVLIELSVSNEAQGRDLLETALAGEIEAGRVADVLIAQSVAQAHAFWTIRETIPLSKRAFGAVIAHDISVPVSAIPDFLDVMGQELGSVAPESDIVAFGHLGDGNLHYSVCAPKDGGMEALLARKADVTRAVHDRVMAFGGSISAEHGIGLEKRDEIAWRKSEVEMDMMRAVKRALDPQNIMNPGRVVAL